MSAFDLAAVVLPFVAGLHRYAVDYGYRGLSRRTCWSNSVLTFEGMALVTAVLLIARRLLP